ncbi:MAG: branched-chain amino acid ABC transporter permease [Anaerolineae bacterium]|nr:branched-chain amino acid ABC transporter permease [Anaerolineae bacterium]
MDTLLQQLINAISLGAIYSLFALGYAMVFSILGVLNLAHSAIFMMGAFFGLIAIDQWGLPLWLAFPVAMLGAGLVSVALELVAFRPLRQRNAARISQLISSIGAAILLVNITQLIFKQIYNSTEAYLPRDLIPSEPLVIEALGLRVVPVRMLIVVIALVLMIVLQYLVNQTRIGQHMRAVAFNQRIAALLGINVSRIFILTFFLAGVLGGAAGRFYGVVFLNVTPFIGEDVALIGLTAIVLGGMRSIQGAVLGGFLVAGLQIFSIVIGGGSFRNAIVFLLLFVILLIRPQGLLGQTESTRA